VERAGQGKSARRRGRRSGGVDTRAEVLAAARALFAERGFERTTIRAIARKARVDPSLVLHYFGRKEDVFLAAIELPFEPETVLPSLVAGDVDSLGERVARFAVAILEDEAARARVLAIVRAAASEPAAAVLLRGLIEQRIRDPIACALAADEAELRAALMGSQIVGLVMARYVVGVQPLAALPPEELIATIAPTFQRYLAEPLRAPN
jgi:AcrR family transcriptional regulator